MTVSQRKQQHLPDEIQTVNEPGVHYQCDSCLCDLTHTIRIKCADPACETEEGVDICPTCFCAGKEFGQHKGGHAYRVIEMNSYPIFTEDWGADEELLLVTGMISQGIGNWKRIAEHVGTRTKAEVEEHYNSVYVNSPDWPLPRMDLAFNIDPAEFQERKRRRIANMNSLAPPPPKIAPTSAPGVHEIATFLPGRLEFEHELDNDAEDLIKDLEFGVCLEYEGDAIPEDEFDADVKARVKWEEERRSGVKSKDREKSVVSVKGPCLTANGTHSNGDSGEREVKSNSEDVVMANGTASTDDGSVYEVTLPPPIETKDSLNFKLTLVEMYTQRVEKRLESKAIMFDRGLLEYKKMQANDKKRQREERELLHRLRPFARLQTAADYEVFAADMLYEAILRKRIQELQQYRRMGLLTPADIDKYEIDLGKRTQSKALPIRDFASDRLQHRVTGRQSSGPDPRRMSMTSLGEGDDRNSQDHTAKSAGLSASGTGPLVRRIPAPLNLANSPSLHLLTPAEQALCSQLRILPKPYLAIKETLVREYARRGGKLRRREARDLVKIDVNKTSRVWDFLVQTGLLKIASEPTYTNPGTADTCSNPGFTFTPSVNGSPQKENAVQIHPSMSSTSNGHTGVPYSPSTQSKPSS